MLGCPKKSPKRPCKCSGLMWKKVFCFLSWSLFIAKIVGFQYLQKYFEPLFQMGIVSKNSVITAI